MHALGELLALALELAHEPLEGVHRVAEHLGGVALLDELTVVVGLGMHLSHALDRELGAIDRRAIEHVAAHRAVAHHEVLGKRGEPCRKASVGHLHVAGDGAVVQQLVERHVGRKVLLGREAELHLHERLIEVT